MLAPSALAAGAARLPLFFRFLFVVAVYHLRVIEHPRACGARPTMLTPSALAAGAARLQHFPVFLFFFFWTQIYAKITILALFGGSAAEIGGQCQIGKCSNFVSIDLGCSTIGLTCLLGSY